MDNLLALLKLEIDDEIRKIVKRRVPVVDGKDCVEYGQLLDKLRIEHLVTKHWNRMITNDGLVNNRLYYKYDESPIDLEVEAKLKAMFRDKGYYFEHIRPEGLFKCRPLEKTDSF